MTQRKVSAVRIRSVKDVGVMVTGVPAAEVRRAVGLLRAKKKSVSSSEEVQKALKLYRVVQKFFKQNGRFKRPYTQKKKKQKK